MNFSYPRFYTLILTNFHKKINYIFYDCFSLLIPGFITFCRISDKIRHPLQISVFFIQFYGRKLHAVAESVMSFHIKRNMICSLADILRQFSQGTADLLQPLRLSHQQAVIRAKLQASGKACQKSILPAKGL